MTKLDYSLQTPEERKELVEKILQENPKPSAQYLEILADYLVLCMEKQEKKERKLLTENRLSTVNKRETSLEGLTSVMETGEDGLYNLINDNPANTLLCPKISITEKDLREIPFLQGVRDAIELWEAKLKKASGREAYIIKKAIIDLRKDQYIIKNAYLKPVQLQMTYKPKFYIPLEEHCTFDEKGYPVAVGVSLLSPKVISAILCNYSVLKEGSWGQFEKDLWYLMEDFDNISAVALENEPLYQRIVELKIDGQTNSYIQKVLEEEFKIYYSLEYISNLWRNKIPKLIASAAEDQFLDYYYLNIEKGQYKKCSHCGEIKLAHSKYFSKNSSSKDGWYSQCKKCRNSKGKKK